MSEKSKTSGIIIIGNEILSGKVKDVNSFYLACELRDLGVDVRRISIIPDEVDLIGKEVVEFSRSFDFVFTCGGVGPTHDDVTMAGIAEGFGVKLIEHPEIKDFLQSKYNNSFNDTLRKMAMVPEGSRVDFSEEIRFPVISFRNVYIFPGIPEYVRKKFSLIKERFRSTAFYLKRLYLHCHESSIAEILNEVVRENREVAFGSYPIVDASDYRVIITVESKSQILLTEALNSLTNKLPSDVIVKIV
jgi:molybdenum cofactor synthesis domain-containing protein